MRDEEGACNLYPLVAVVPSCTPPTQSNNIGQSYVLPAEAKSVHMMLYIHKQINFHPDCAPHTLMLSCHLLQDEAAGHQPANQYVRCNYKSMAMLTEWLMIIEMRMLF